MRQNEKLSLYNSLNKFHLRRQIVDQFLFSVVMLAAFVLLLSCESSVRSKSTTISNPKTTDTLVNAFSFPVTDSSIIRLDKTCKGDFDDMKKRRVIRALVVYNATSFFFDNNGLPQGISYEGLTAFEKFINRNHNKQEEKIHVIQIPVRRDQLLPYLLNGNADIVAANLTITEERKAQADFSNPSLTGVKEIVVTGPKAPSINKLEDLAGQDVWVRESSSYYTSLMVLNQKFKQQGLTEINIRKAEEQLETEELLEMVASDVINITISDDYLAEAWAEVFNTLTLHSDLAISQNGEIAMMFRQNSPLLKNEINTFIAKNKKGSLFFNMKFNQYYNSEKRLKQIYSSQLTSKQSKINTLFKTYAKQYNFDWMIIAAMAYQESHLDQNKISQAGAIGVMQLLQSTANDPNVNIPNIHILEDNIHAGIKYLRFIFDRYYANNQMDKLNQHLFTFASYNAGPARITQLRKQAEREGFNPNIWFQNVEIIAGREIGRETVQYVTNIFKYYVAYKLAFEQTEQ